MEKINRRKFLQVLGISALAAPVAGSLVKPQKVYALEVPQVPLDEAAAKSKQFGYYADATKVDATKYPKRAGEEGKTQFCSNCQLLVKSGIKLEGKEETYGVCSLFQEGLAAEKGWCNMWVKKIN